MKYTFLLYLALLCGNLCAQKKGQPLIDSLLGQLPKMKDDSDKVRALAFTAQAYMMTDPMQGFGYAEKALQLAEDIHWKKGIANVNNNLGLMIGDTGNNTLARVYFEKSYALNKELGSKTNQINNLNNIGRSYQRESDFSRATDYFFRALSIAEDMKSDEQISLVGTNITASFYSQKNYAKATEYAEMTLKHAELAKSKNNMGKALLQLGVIKMDLKDSAASRVYFGKALKVYEDMGYRSQVANVLANMAQLEYPNYRAAIDTMLKAQAIYDETGPSSVGSIANIANLGQTYYTLALRSDPAGKALYLQRSEIYLRRGATLCHQTSNAEFLATITRSIADLEEQKGNYKAALDDYKTWSGINDSLFSQDKKNEIAGLEGKHNLAVKDNEIAINQLMLTNQRRTQLALIAGLFLAAVIGSLLYWQSRNRKKTNTTLMVLNNQLDEANKVKAKFFGILSHDLRGPVANLLHFLHLQKNDPDLLNATWQADHRQKITESAEGLLDTMEAMLLWSKEQMESFKPDIKDVAVDDLFGHLQKLFPCPDQLTIRYVGTGGLAVATDENYLRIIMQNLTSNAIKVLKNTPGASIIWEARKEGNKTILSITDNGPGISDDQAKALYDDSVTTNTHSGFGLHLIRDLAKAIRYKISIQSRPGMGTTFTLSA